MSYISATTINDEVHVWERAQNGERVHRSYAAPFYFYIDDPEGDYTTIYGTPVTKLCFNSSKEYNSAKNKLKFGERKLWESDIRPEIRFLSSQYYGVKAPQLHVTLLDIEVDFDPAIGFSSPSDPYAPINAIAVTNRWKNTIYSLSVPPKGTDWTAESLEQAIIAASVKAPLIKGVTLKVEVFKDEKALLLRFLDLIEDSDLLSGWNSEAFDMPYIAMRIAIVLDGVKFDLSTREEIDDRGRTVFKYIDDPNVYINGCKNGLRHFKRLDIGGLNPGFQPIIHKETGKIRGHALRLTVRIAADMLHLYKKYQPGEKPSYKLSAISDDELVDDSTGEPTLPKLEYQGSLADLYKNDYPFFCRYNIRDDEILEGFERKLGYIELANQICHLSTALFTHVNGTLKLAELALVNYCHHTLKRVVKNVTEPEIDRAIDGALVLLPQVGLHEFVGSIDINSLYPSAIRSINISPETIYGQFLRCAYDAQQIADNTEVECTLEMENGNTVTMRACEWRTFLQDHKIAVSGYGTTFTQDKQGFIPALLAEWYAMRKQYQAKKKEAGARAEAILAKYKK